MPYQLKPKSPKVILLGIFMLAIASIFAFQFARAGSLTPGGSPASSMYTLSDIYTRLTTNATATEGGHGFSPAGSPASSMHSLKEIYEAIPTIVASTVKSGTTYLGVIGTMLGDTDGSKVLTTASTPGTYNATNLNTNTVKSGTTFGVGQTGAFYGDISQSKVLVSANAAGTALANLYNGTGQGFTGGTQASAGVDDYNNAGSPTTGRYTGGWTQCSAGNNYCGTGSTAADARDDSTGLVWSLPCNGSACATFSDSSPATYSWDSSAANNGGKTASQLCEDAGWNLPHQKQLMMAYIDGSYGNLEASGVGRGYWSGTTVSYGTGGAWYTGLSNGSTYNNSKTNTGYVRCVRFSLGN